MPAAPAASRISLRSIRATMFANVIARSDLSPVVRRMGVRRETGKE